MASNTVVLITGVNRGLGKGLLETYLARPRHTVIGAVRDPSAATATALHDLPKGPSSSLILVKIDSASETDAHAAVTELQSAHGIRSLDLVIANAGILKEFPRVEAVQPAAMLEHYQVNVVAPVLLFQATLPLLLQSSAAPKFVAIGSSAGSIGGMELRPYPNAAYGPTKAALNYLVKKIHLEHESIIAFPVDPGWPRSDMGDFAAASFGLPQAEITVADSARGIVSVIDGATRENTSGHFLVYTGEECAW
ncbi:hypothetical protein VTN02DRAFT_2486 [Thermoascus thermophilus]